MILAARILAGLVAAILLFLGVRYMFTPDAVQSFTALTPDNEFGRSNLRAMGAPLIMLGIITAIGAIKTIEEFFGPGGAIFSGVDCVPHCHLGGGRIRPRRDPGAGAGGGVLCGHRILSSGDQTDGKAAKSCVNQLSRDSLGRPNPASRRAGFREAINAASRRAVRTGETPRSSG